MPSGFGFEPSLIFQVAIWIFNRVLPTSCSLVQPRVACLSDWAVMHAKVEKFPVPMLTSPVTCVKPAQVGELPALQKIPYGKK